MSDTKSYSGGLPFKIPKIPEHVGIGWVIALIVLLVIAIIFGLAQSTGYLVTLIFISVGVVAAMVYFSQPKMGMRPMPPPRQYGPPPQQPYPHYNTDLRRNSHCSNCYYSN
jgi:hypothetical protein